MAKKKLSDHRADTRGAGFAGIPISVIKSEAYRHLDPMERAVLVEIVARMNGFNNGEIAISYSELAGRLNRRNQACFAPAIAKLMQHGLLDVGTESKWKQRLARTYRLTFVNTADSIGRPIKATNEYLNWEPGVKSSATDVVAEKPRSATTFVAGKGMAATDVVATHNGKLPKTLKGSATDVVVLISKPYPGTETPRSKTDEIGPPNASGPSAACAGGQP